MFDAKTLSGRLVQALEALGGTEVPCRSRKYRCFHMPNVDGRDQRHYFVGRCGGFRFCDRGPIATDSVGIDPHRFLARAERTVLNQYAEQLRQREGGTGPAPMTVGAVMAHKAESDFGGATALRLAKMTDEEYADSKRPNAETCSWLKPAGGDPLSYGIACDGGADDCGCGHASRVNGWDPILLGA